MTHPPWISYGTYLKLSHTWNSESCAVTFTCRQPPQCNRATAAIKIFQCTYSAHRPLPSSAHWILWSGNGVCRPDAPVLFNLTGGNFYNWLPIEPPTQNVTINNYNLSLLWDSQNTIQQPTGHLAHEIMLVISRKTLTGLHLAIKAYSVSLAFILPNVDTS